MNIVPVEVSVGEVLNAWRQLKQEYAENVLQDFWLRVSRGATLDAIITIRFESVEAAETFFNLVTAEKENTRQDYVNLVAELFPQGDKIARSYESEPITPQQAANIRTFLVPSSSRRGVKHRLSFDAESHQPIFCSCEEHQFNKTAFCKHMTAASHMTWEEATNYWEEVK